MVLLLKLLLSPLDLYSGFCHRFPFDEFLARYRHLSTDFQFSLLPNTRESVQHLLASVSRVIDDIDVSDDNFALGTTKVFLK
jgi:myosin heavy subunit